MQDILTLLKDNAEWLFGTGGIAALVLGALKIFSPKKGGTQVTGSFVGGDVVGGNKISGEAKSRSHLLTALLSMSIIAFLAGASLLTAKSIGWLPQTAPTSTPHPGPSDAIKNKKH